MATGCLIVAIDAGGISELIRSGDNAVLAASGDQAAMVAALQTLLDHPALAAQYGNQTWEYCRTGFQADQIAKEAEAVFMDAITRGV